MTVYAPLRTRNFLLTTYQGDFEELAKQGPRDTHHTHYVGYLAAGIKIDSMHVE